METELNVLLTNAALLMVVVERAVSHIKSLVRTDLKTKPWPIISFGISGFLTFSYQLYILEALLGHGPTAGPELVGNFADWLVSSSTIAGGSAGIIDMIKSLSRTKDKATQATKSTS